MFVVLRWCLWRFGGFYSVHFSSVHPWRLVQPLRNTAGPAANCISPLQNWMKKIIIQCSRWSNLLAQHHERVGSEGGAAQAADVKGERRWLACRNAEGTSAPDPSSNKIKLQKYPFLDGRFQEFCQLSLKTRLQPQSCFLQVWGCVDSDQRMWFILAL